MAKATGQRFILETSQDDAQYTKVGSMRSKQLQRSKAMIETSSDEDPGWSTTIAGQRSWSMSGETLYVYDNAGQEAIEAAYESDDPVHFRLTQIDQAGEPVVGSNQFKGLAHVTEASLQASTNEVVTYSLSAQGTGPLVRTAVAA